MIIPKLTFDTKEFERAMKNAELTKGEKLEVLRAGGKTIANRQRELVPVLTGATKGSIDVRDVEDYVEVGPTTTYAGVIEEGDPTRPNYPAQPFVRPSVFGRGPAIQGQMSKTANLILKRKGL